MAPRERPLIEGALTHSVIGAFFEVYNELGFGFMERVYSLAMERELIDRGHRVKREAPVTVLFRGRVLTRQPVDLLVDDKVIVEIKSTWKLPASAIRQLYSYLRSTPVQVGLLFHFGAEPRYHRLISTRPPPK